MKQRIVTSLLTLAVICPFYVGTVGECCSGQCNDSSNPCTLTCYEPATPCPNPEAALADGTECPFSQGVAGQCVSGQCQEHECHSQYNLFPCEHPYNGGDTGICIDGRCVASTPTDKCVFVNFGRINCCSQQGCENHDGVLCGDTDHSVHDGESCDPSGVLPLGQGEGTCQDGVCTIGTCTATACNYADNCKAVSCDPTTPTATCAYPAANGFLSCTPIGGAPQSDNCEAGACGSGGDPPFDCSDDNACTKDIINRAYLIGGACPNKVCCEHEPASLGAPCTLPGASRADGSGGASQGQCDGAGNCVPLPSLCQPPPS